MLAEANLTPKFVIVNIFLCKEAIMGISLSFKNSQRNVQPAVFKNVAVLSDPIPGVMIFQRTLISLAR